MDSREDEHQNTFRSELSSLIERHSGSLTPKELTSVLDECSVALSSGSLAPRASVMGDAEPYQLVLEYDSPVALERDLNNLLEIQGLVVDVERDLPALSSLKIEVRVVGLNETVELAGRPVSQTAQGTAIQVEDVDAAKRTQLKSLPGAARRRAYEQESEASWEEPVVDALEESSAAVGESVPPRHGTPRDEPHEANDWVDLEVDSFRDALVEAALRPGLWLLDVVTDEHRIQMLLSRGELRDLRRFPRPPNDRLEMLLHKAGELSRADVRSVERHVEIHGGGAAEALLELATMSVAQISVAESTRIRYLLDRVWGATPRKARLAELNLLPRRCMAPSRHALEFVFHLLREEALEREDLRALCKERFDNTVFRVSPNPPFDLGVMSLTAKQLSTIEMLSRDKLRLDDAMRMSVISDEETRSLLWSLDELGLLDVETVRTWTRKQSRTMERISLMYAKLDRSTHFDMLGVHWSAFDEEVENAYAELSERVAEESIDEDMPDEYHAKAAAVRERLDEAYEAIANGRRRANYRSRVVDEFKLRTSVQMFEKQADTAKLRRDISGAIDFYLRILELDPNHADAKRDLAMLREVQEKKNG